MTSIMYTNIKEKNQVTQILIKAFNQENVAISMDEAKIGVSNPLPQSIKQILNGKIHKNKRNGIYEYELIIKIHNHFLFELVKYFEINLKAPKKPKKSKQDSTTKINLKEIQETELEKQIANITLKRLGWLK